MGFGSIMDVSSLYKKIASPSARGGFTYIICNPKNKKGQPDSPRLSFSLPFQLSCSSTRSNFSHAAESFLKSLVKPDALNNTYHT